MKTKTTKTTKVPKTTKVKTEKVKPDSISPKKDRTGSKTKELLKDTPPAPPAPPVSITSDAPEFSKETTTDTTSPVDTTINPTPEATKSEKVTKAGKNKKTEEPAAPAEKFFSDKVFEIVGDGVKFLGNQYTVNAGTKIQRIGINKYRFSGIDEEKKVVFEDHDFNDAEANLFEGQLGLYEKGLGNRKNIPNMSNTSNIADIIKKQEQRVYSKVEEMEAYAETILQGILNSPNVKMFGKTIPQLNIENQLKIENKEYKYELKQNDGKFYIEMALGLNVVRIPKNEKEFLPVH